MTEFAKITITKEVIAAAPALEDFNEELVEKVAAAMRAHFAAIERQLAEMILHWPPDLREPIQFYDVSGNFLGLGENGAKKPCLWALSAYITATRPSAAIYNIC